MTLDLTAVPTDAEFEAMDAAAERLATYWAKLMPDVSIGTPSKPDGHVHRAASCECLVQLVREELARQGLGWLDVQSTGARSSGCGGIEIGGPAGWLDVYNRSSYAQITGPGWGAVVESAARSYLDSRPCGVCRGAWPMLCTACATRGTP